LGLEKQNQKTCTPSGPTTVIERAEGGEVRQFSTRSREEQRQSVRKKNTGRKKAINRHCTGTPGKKQSGEGGGATVRKVVGLRLFSHKEHLHRMPAPSKAEKGESRRNKVAVTSLKNVPMIRRGEARTIYLGDKATSRPQVRMKILLLLYSRGRTYKGGEASESVKKKRSEREKSG